MVATALEFRRQLLLKASIAYAGASTAVPAAALLHGHLVPVLSLVTLTTGIAIAISVVRLHELRRVRRSLLAAVLLSGPLGPWILARHTRTLLPVRVLRPAGRPRR